MKKASLTGSVQVKGDKVRVIVRALGTAPIDGVIVNVMVPAAEARLNVDDTSAVHLVETDDPPVNRVLGPVDLAVVERRMFPDNVYFWDLYVETDLNAVSLRVEASGLGPRGPVSWACDGFAPGPSDATCTFTEEA